MGFWTLLEWYNLPFVLPFAAALLYLLSSSFGLIADNGDSDADMRAEIDCGCGAEMQTLESVHAIDGTADIEHDFESDVEHDTAAHDSGYGFKALSLLGFGRIPTSIILMSFCFLWGFSGMATNMLIGDLPWMSKIFFIPTGIIAWITAISGTSVIARGFSRIMPSTETYAVSLPELAGQVAEVRYQITEKSGTAVFYDAFGTFREVECRIAPGESSISADTKVVLLRYDARAGAFVVKRDPLGPLLSHPL